MSAWGFNRESNRSVLGANTAAGYAKGNQPYAEAHHIASKRNVIATNVGWVRRTHKTTHGNARVIDEVLVAAHPGVAGKDYTSNTYLGQTDLFLQTYLLIFMSYLIHLLGLVLLETFARSVLQTQFLVTMVLLTGQTLQQHVSQTLTIHLSSKCLHFRAAALEVEQQPQPIKLTHRQSLLAVILSIIRMMELQLQPTLLLLALLLTICSVALAHALARSQYVMVANHGR